MLESCLSELAYIKETLDNEKQPVFFGREFSFFLHEPTIFFRPSFDQVIYANKKFTGELGYTAADFEAAGYSSRELFCDNHHDSFLKLLIQAKEDEMHVSDFCLLDKSGKKSMFRFYCRHLYKGCYTIRLEKKDTGTLESARKELEEFAYIASHDLQEPLRKITTFLQRLEHKIGDTADEDVSMYIKRINISAGNMRNLIDGLLEYSRINRNKEFAEPVDLSEACAEVIAELTGSIEQSGATINMEKLPVVEAKPSQVNQLLLHVLDNAIKFRKPDIAPVINITSRVVTGEEKLEHNLAAVNEYVLLTISDNGIGFDPEYTARIFQLFQRLHGKHEYPGTGMGLGICKKIATHNKGDMFADSVPGEGSRFFIILPKAVSTNV